MPTKHSCSVFWMSSRGCTSFTVGFSIEIGHNRSLCALPSERHVMVIVMLLGKLEEDGSVCLYTSAAWRRQGGGGTMTSDDCEWRPIDVIFFFFSVFSDLVKGAA